VKPRRAGRSPRPASPYPQHADARRSTRPMLGAGSTWEADFRTGRGYLLKNFIWWCRTEPPTRIIRPHGFCNLMVSPETERPGSKAPPEPEPAVADTPGNGTVATRRRCGETWLCRPAGEVHNYSALPTPATGRPHPRTGNREHLGQHSAVPPQPPLHHTLTLSRPSIRMRKLKGRGREDAGTLGHGARGRSLISILMLQSSEEIR
jgi:hypothetical protein